MNMKCIETVKVVCAVVVMCLVGAMVGAAVVYSPAELIGGCDNRTLSVPMHNFWRREMRLFLTLPANIM